MSFADESLFFFDESRFGTHSKIGYGWFETGTRPRVNVKLGFHNFYIYSAVNPISGKSFTLQLPSVNSDCMNVFLEEMTKDLESIDIYLVMDGAGWHKSKSLKIPNNVNIIYLPPYSPELNPVERLWLYIKQNTIKNRIYDNVITLQDAVCSFINTLQPNIIKQICTLNY